VIVLTGARESEKSNRTRRYAPVPATFEMPMLSGFTSRWATPSCSRSPCPIPPGGLPTAVFLTGNERPRTSGGKEWIGVSAPFLHARAVLQFVFEEPGHSLRVTTLTGRNPARRSGTGAPIAPTYEKDWCGKPGPVEAREAGNIYAGDPRQQGTARPRSESGRISRELKSSRTK
jgi:hypothetical protein